MASTEPTPDEVSQVIDFAGLNPVEDRTMVINALKNNSRNVESVVMSYFDNPESFRQKFRSVWNDSMFSAGKDGDTDNSTGISFHIESLNQNDVIQGVTPPGEPYVSGAPSRPPSRSNDRSPLGRMVEWTAGDVPASEPAPYMTQTSEDDDIARALRESAVEAGIPVGSSAQETGVVGAPATAPYFGPATRTEYDQADWAMVPVGSTANKANDGPAPSLRKRQAGAPAFLTQQPNVVGNHGLGGLLTILNQIPLARNIMLECGSPADSYGFDNEWWKGKEILPQYPVSQNESQSSDLEWGSEDETRPGFEEEIHRLMAFLDSTERSYGSVSVLTNSVPYPSLGPEKQFYEVLGGRNVEKISPLCQVATLALVNGDDQGDEDARFGLLEIEHLRSEYVNIKTLYEAFDHLMWSDVLSWNEMHDGSKMAMFKEMGEVLAIRMGGDGPEEGIDIPEVFLPEKYLASRKDEARRIQRAWCDTKTELTKIARAEQMLNEWRDDFGQISYDKAGKMKKAQEQWAAFQDYLSGADHFHGMQELGFDTTKFPDYRDAPAKPDDDTQGSMEKVDNVMRLTETVLADMDSKLNELKEQLEKTRMKQRLLGRLLTVADKPGRPKPMECNRYLLRGVATERDIVYVCQRQQPDLIEIGNEPKPLDQWWRLALVPTDEEQPVKAEKITIERVLREVWQETKTPVLIYATETALNTQKLPLRGPLERFVKAENKAFRQELTLEISSQEDAAKQPFIDPISPSKRKHRSDSMDSLDSNRASLGSDGGNGFNNPFEDQFDKPAVETVDFATSNMGFEQEAGTVDAGPPTLSEGQPRYGAADPMDNTSATMTPNTVSAEDVDLTNTASTQNAPTTVEDDSQSTSLMDAKEPEMQELGRPPLVARPSQSPERARRGSAMDMEISDQQAS